MRGTAPLDGLTNSTHLTTRLAQLWQALYQLLMAQRRLRRNLRFYTEFLHYSEHDPIVHAEELASIEEAKNEDFEFQACQAGYKAARQAYIGALIEAKHAVFREYQEVSRGEWEEGDWQIRIDTVPEFDCDSAMIMETSTCCISLSREAAEELRFCVDMDSNLVFTGKHPDLAGFLASYARDYLAGDPRKVCPFCDAEVDIAGFRDALSLREHRISGLCQSCQDSVFG